MWDAIERSRCGEQYAAPSDLHSLLPKLVHGLAMSALARSVISTYLRELLERAGLLRTVTGVIDDMQLQALTPCFGEVVGGLELTVITEISGSRKQTYRTDEIVSALHNDAGDMAAAISGWPNVSANRIMPTSWQSAPLRSVAHLARSPGRQAD